jgi:alpha-glucosidase (family GH31 glycosyl hydrolase)
MTSCTTRTARDAPYRYVPVNQFTPLSDTHWLALTEVVAGEPDPDNPWRFILSVRAVNRGTGAVAEAPYTVHVELVSYTHNIFRVRFDPAGKPKDKTFGPVTQPHLDMIRDAEIEAGAPATPFSFVDNSLALSSRDLLMILSRDFQMTVVDSAANVCIHQDAVDGNGHGLGVTFVEPDIGAAVATVKVNRKDSEAPRERFYGQGEVNVNVGGKDGYYVVSKTGLAMTNFNYDQITYYHDELLPGGYGLTRYLPNYYLPMYFSAPWLMVVGSQGSERQYAYGLYLDNPSQTYANSGDTAFGAQAGASDKFYLGAQAGELDYYFVFGEHEAGTTPQGVEQPVKGLAYLCQDTQAAGFAKRAAMPPKYMFGYFQGVYGAVALNAGAYPADYPVIDNAIYFSDILKGYRDGGFPLEGFAVDIDVQDTYKVFTINERFYLDGDRDKASVFAWAHENGLVTQTNITCFIKDTEPSYAVLKSLIAARLYTNNKGAGGAVFRTDGFGPDDAYCGQLQYGEYARITAIFPDWGRAGTDTWWGPHYRPLIDAGLDFVWQDMTTPSMATHVKGREVTDDSFDLGRIMAANSGNLANPDDAAYAETFNWRSYHPAVLLTDPRYGDQALRSFAQTRNQHAYALCSATYGQAVKALGFSKFQRSYIIARGGQIGSQQFGGLWLGDNSTDWLHLNLMVPMVVSMNMSGMSVVGADIGGFAQTGETGTSYCAPELLARWVQAGCLLPWFRNHYDRYLGLDPSSSDDPSRWTPKGHGKKFQELYNAAYASHHASMISAIALRYRWQEVLYTAAYDYVAKGAPMLKAMCMWDGDPNIDYDARPGLNSQFLLGGPDGRQILVAPILTQAMTSRAIYFPQGANWFPYYLDGDVRDLDRYQTGGVDVTVNAGIDNLPIYVREGAILPTRYSLDESAKGINAYTPADPLVFDIFSAAFAGQSGVCYLDDGGATTSAEESGQYGIVRFTLEAVEEKSARFVINYARNRFTWSADSFARLRAVGTVSRVALNGVEMTRSSAASRGEFFRREQGAAVYWVDGATGSVWLRIPHGTFDQASASVEITCSDTINRAQPY